jgi:hypothetical protein
VPELPVPDTKYVDASAGELNGADPGIFQKTEDGKVTTWTLEGGLGRLKRERTFTPARASGPNEGLWYFKKVEFTEMKIFIRSSLEKNSAFALKQHYDNPNTPDKFCTSASIEALGVVAEQHEQSHFAAVKRVFHYTAESGHLRRARGH